MVILGLLLVVLGGLAIVSAVFASDVDSGGQLSYLSIELSPLALFLVGVGSAVAVLLGLALLRWGSKRSLAQRRERRRLTELSAKLDDVDAERRHDLDRHGDEDRPTL